MYFDLTIVFPLRGKLLNVRDATHDMIMKNVEINAIRQIMGLQHGKRYEDTKSLRYGHLMIMTDQDHDGSHIKGLIINYFETFYPSLLAIPGFLIEFITPIVRVRKGDKDISFFTMPEYEYWKETTPDCKSWHMKYYKVRRVLLMGLMYRVWVQVRQRMRRYTLTILTSI
jgi:DNA topoisomerase II